MDASSMPAYNMINITGVVGDDPLDALRAHQAALSAHAHPQLRVLGHPRFGAAEQTEGRWRLLFGGDNSPEHARRTLASRIRGTVRPDDPDELPASRFPNLVPEDERPALREAFGAELRALVERIDPELGGDTGAEWAVGGRRYRIVRSPALMRFGPEGPEPVHDTDTDPPPGLPGRDPQHWFVLDPAAPTTLTDGLLRMEICRGPGGPEQDAHPGVVLLPVRFLFVRRGPDGWIPTIWEEAGPGLARHRVIDYLRHTGDPRFRELTGTTDEDVAQAARDADALEAADQAADVTIEDEPHRLCRLMPILRVGPDGPEPVRPEDEALNEYF
ncbi:DUF5954 family protein [Actinomadura parmotrematis]|uniref:Uncharacterized protein n=1 Tax=Actinomadura parmotrematis TaxID=2864039 RepID=A0ABS7FMW9_9ACTN|nr:DUF5954 family protein [Actinomadura parmotrematis]MBW8481729.1 hypothetical protein [Actinomadura parmotrematis]